MTEGNPDHARPENPQSGDQEDQAAAEAAEQVTAPDHLSSAEAARLEEIDRLRVNHHRDIVLATGQIAQANQDIEAARAGIIAAQQAFRDGHAAFTHHTEERANTIAKRTEIEGHLRQLNAERAEMLLTPEQRAEPQR